MVDTNNASVDDGSNFIPYSHGGGKPLSANFTIKIANQILDVYVIGSREVKIYVKLGKMAVAGVSLDKSDLPFPAYEIGTAGVMPQFVGHGIIKLLYYIIMKDYDFALIGSEQSAGARKTWSSLSAKRDISSYAFSLYNNSTEFHEAYLSPGRYRFRDGNKMRLMDSYYNVLLTKKMALLINISNINYHFRRSLLRNAILARI